MRLGLPQLIQDQKVFEKASGDEKRALQKKLRKKAKTIQFLEKEHRNLTRSWKNQGQQLAKSYLQQQELIDDLGKANELGQNYFQQLQNERAREEAKQNVLLKTHNALFNDLLDQQEKDQTKSWWKKIFSSVNVYPNVALNKTVKKEYPIIQENAYFFSNSSSSVGSPAYLPEVVTIKDPQTNTEKIIKPERN